MTVDITLRQVKGAPLTFDEVDDNFSNLKAAADLASGDLSAIESDVTGIDARLTTAEGEIDTLQSAATTLTVRVDAIETDYTTESQAESIADNAVAAHVALADPHTQYLTGAESVNFAATKSAGDTLALSLPDAATVIVTADESQGGVRVRYTVTSAALTGGVVDTAVMSRFTQAGTGAVARTAQDKMREVVSVKDFGAVGDGVTDDTAAIQAAHAASTNVHYPDGSYLIGWAEGTSLVSYTGVSGIKVTGNAKLVDARTYASGSFTNVFKLSNCTDVDIQLGYTGHPIVSKSDPTVGIGYRGANFVKLESGCKRVKVKGRLEYLRYGVVAGDYTTPSLGENDALTIDLTTIECGYPVALYLSTGVDINLRSEGSHRTAYLAGVRGGKCHAYFKDQYIAPIQVLMTDATTNGGTYPTGTSRGCSDLKIIAHDMGSTIFTANSFCAGISMSRGDAGTTFQDIEVDVYVKSSDTVASTLSTFGIYNSFTSIQPSYPNEWESSFVYRNIKLTGTLDRSAQTIAENSGNGEIYYFLSDNTRNATANGLDISGLKYYPGSGAKTRGFYYFVPGLVGTSCIENCDFGTTTPFLIATNATSLVSIKSTSLRGSYAGTSDSPYNSSVSFTDCTIFDPAHQPMANKTFFNTTIRGSKTSVITKIITTSALSGASVTLSAAIPAGSVVVGVSGIVTTAITGATGFEVGTVATPTLYANKFVTAQGTLINAVTDSSATTPLNYISFTNLVITSKGSNFTGGVIRLAIHYISFTNLTL